MAHFDRYDIVSAYYAFYSEHHSGQFSDAYSKLCRLEESPIRFRPGAAWRGYESLSNNGKEIYNNLCDKHSVSNPNEIPDDCIVYTLPESWASVIVNDDWSGLDDEQANIIESFLNNELKPGQHLTIVDYEQESNFKTYHDARNYGWLADNCYRFILMEN